MITMKEWMEEWDPGTLQGAKGDAFQAVADRDGDTAVIIMGVGIEALVLVDGLDDVVRILKNVVRDMEDPGHPRWSRYPKESGL